MPEIVLETYIHAEVQLVFDLCRSVDMHKFSTRQTKETAIAGVTSGLMGAGDTVTWRARHLGFYQTLTVRITQFNSPYFFKDVIQKGIFTKMEHQHSFEADGDMVCMKDIFTYKAPLGILGKLADILFLENYMRNFLIQRNLLIKEVAESGAGEQLLSNTPDTNNKKPL